MQLSVIAALIPLVSLVTAVGNWNCYNKDSDKAKAFSQFEDWYPNGACVNDAGVGLPAQMCTSVRRGVLETKWMDTDAARLGPSLHHEPQWYHGNYAELKAKFANRFLGCYPFSDGRTANCS
ncbi:uncharacterized protein SETTUDRAFT_30117 [Exserohilum turcica Et28A]|uniref:Uncharacterized protein n=1 Tax=Exserohilum turcicum (strain 28A) TaxID=671987 RepID=R0KFJ4_EXST2|nr:uncharacterized protein SETTUDRAFT_30117 [Exserohilum turcica Et28A]EOA91588.1 hypothetical protein SETTUDRAFT_30117 [Exserohilum turcica Et28A]